MARFAAALALALLLGSCAETVSRPSPPPVNWASLKPPKPVAPPPRLAATEKERATADAYLKALASPGFAKLSAILDEEAHFRFTGTRDFHGREDVVKAHADRLGMFDGRTFTANRVLLTDSSQVLEWTMTGTERSSKKPVVIRGLSLLWTKDDGSISDAHMYFDQAVVQAQLGGGPEALRGFRPAPPTANGAPPIEQTRSPDEAAHVAVVKAALQALEDNKEAAYLGLMTEDVELSTLESNSPAIGKAGPRSWFKTLREGIAYLSISLENAWGIGPYVVVEYHLVGEQRRPLGWIPLQKDKLIKLSVVDVVEIRDGKMAHITRYEDPLQIVASP
jgi:ketosteroid isomerase-like protein